jgi:hypothetical protein
MLRAVLSAIGLLMISMPYRIIDTAERLAFENPERATLRRTTIPIARLEGVGYLLLVRRTGFLSGMIGLVFGLFGSAAAVAPRQYLEGGLSLAYENPEDISVKSWVLPWTRVLGVTAIVLTVASLRDDGAD